MDTSIAFARTWPDPRHLVLRWFIAFAIVLGLAWLWGKELVSLILPLAGAAIPWLDDHFRVLALELGRDHQDSIIKLRVNLESALFLGGRIISPHPEGWLEVTTTVGTMLQPLVIALGIAAAWPSGLRAVLISCLAALLLSGVVLLVDLPLTLHAYVWDMFHAHYDPEGFSPLLAWHQFMQMGGRLGLGAMIGATACAVAGGRLTG